MMAASYVAISLIYSCIGLITLVQAAQPKIKRCTGEKFDALMCPIGTYIDVVGADFYSYFYGFGPGIGMPAGCEGHPDDCRQNIVDDHSDYFDEMKRKCNGKVTCDDLVAEEHEPVLCGSDFKASSYVIMQYNCLDKYHIDPDSDSVQMYSKKCPSAYHQLECPEHNIINIVDGFYGGFQGQTCSPRGISEYDCLANMLSSGYAGRAYLNSLRNECDSRTRCSVTSSSNSVYTAMCRNQALYSSGRYELLVYECIPDLVGSRKCKDDSFHDVTCAPNTAIKIVSASFGDKQGDLYRHAPIARCQRELLGSASYHCQVDIEDEDSRYFREIIDKCEYNTRCNDLRAKSVHVDWCHEEMDQIASYSEYVTIEYKCVLGYSYDTDNRRGTIWSVLGRRTQDLLVPILAGVAGFILLIVIILIIVICTMKKKRRRAAEREKEEERAAQRNGKERKVAETNLDARPPEGVREAPVDVDAPDHGGSAPGRAPYAEPEQDVYDRAPRWNFVPCTKTADNNTTASDESFHKQYTPAARATPARVNSTSSPSSNEDNQGSLSRKRYDEAPVPHQPTTIRDIYSIPRKYDNRPDTNDVNKSDNFLYQPALFV